MCLRCPGQTSVDRRMRNRVSYTLDSTLDSVNHAESKAHEIAAKAGFSEDDQYNIAMAVREAAVNAVHGNARDPAKKFFVAYETAVDPRSPGPGEPHERIGTRDFPDSRFYGRSEVPQRGSRHGNYIDQTCDQ